MICPFFFFFFFLLIAHTFTNITLTVLLLHYLQILFAQKKKTNNTLRTTVTIQCKLTLLEIKEKKNLQTLYCDIESGVMNNGWMSECFKIERGVRQGCPLSPYLFVLSVEVLASAIRSDQHIKGISVNQKEIKLSQYADDTTLILDGSKDALETSLDVIGKFSKISGLRLNNKKTEALWIGSKARSQDITFPEKGFRWQHLKIKTLGVWLSIEPELTVKLNFNEKKEKVRNLLRNWQYRRLSLLGKIAILKSLIASQLVHVLSPLPTNHQAIKELNGAFYHFLWDGKPDKIKRNIMINDYSNGGLKMIDLFSFNKSLKTIWIKKYLDKTNLGKWKLFFERELGRYGGEAVFLGNLNKTDIKHHFSSTNIFINEILMIWSEVNTNFLLTERQGRTGEYWPEVVAVQKRPRANIPQYGPEQVKLVSSLLYGIIFRTKQHFR